jgi:hypothetical protein
MLLPEGCPPVAESDSAADWSVISVVEKEDCHCGNCGKYLWGEHTSHCNACHSVKEG